MRKIFVSGASGVVGYGILKSLRNSSESFYLIGSTIHSNSPAVVYSDLVLTAVPTSSDEYIEWLLSVIEKYDVDMIIPAIEADVYKWNENRDILGGTGAKLLLNNANLINLCSDKWVFYNTLKSDISKYLIPTFESVDTITCSFPLVAKPKVGFGSKGVYRINSMEELEKFDKGRDGTYIYQPFIGKDSEEYTVSAFFDRNCVLVEYLGLKRRLSQNGHTDYAEFSDYDFRKILEDLSSLLKPIGPTNFQFRYDNGHMKLLEINPRISSSTSIRALMGFNESEMSVNYLFYEKISCKLDKKGLKNKKIIRYFEDYMYDDSTD